MRIVILSDLHLGRPHGGLRDAESLRPVWANADRLIVNGDTAEIHHPEHRVTAAREALALLDACEAAGTALTLLSGNHDPYISDRRHLLLADGRVFVTHGDVLHPAVSPWSPAGRRIRATHDLALAALEPEARAGLEARLSASQHASYAEWADAERLESEAAQSSILGMLVRPWALVQVLHYWWIVPHLAAGFLHEHAPGARFMVFGHTHRAGIWSVRDRVIVNTGSFGFPGRPRAVVLENGSLEVRGLRRRRAHWEFGAPIRRYELESGAGDP